MNFKSFIIQRKLTILILFILFIPLTVSIIIYQSSKNHQKEALDLFKLLNCQTEVHHRIVSSLSELHNKNVFNKKKLQVFISDFQQIKDFNKNFFYRINDDSAIKDLISEEVFNKFSLLSSDLENNLNLIIEIQKKPKSYKLADPDKMRKILTNKEEYSELIDSFENILFDEILASTELTQNSLLVTFFIFLGTVIYIGFLIIKPSYYRINILTSHINKIENDYTLLSKNSEELNLKIKLLEDSLNESQTKYQAVFDNMFDGFAYYKVLLDEKDQTEDYVLLEVNDAFEGLTGLKRENVVGKKLTEIFPGIKESRYNWIGKYDNVALHGEKVRFEHHAKNIERWHNISAYSPIKGYFVTLFEDITQRKIDAAAINHYISELQASKEKIENDANQLVQLNIKLRDSEKMLKELNANKDKFFSIIAHDLRTPFNALTGLSELLSNQIEVLSIDEIKEYSSNIHSSSVKLFSLLENLLKWSGLQSGRIVKVPTYFYIDSLILSITELYKNNMVSKGINLVLDLSPNVKVFADRDMIETVLRNLFSNAIKFTNKEGTVTIIMKSGPSFTEIMFSDTGIGIDQSIINKLFKLSEHITSSGTENEKGTGLGLILCKEFVEKNGGNITVCSEPGKGSKFTFTIPK